MSRAISPNGTAESHRAPAAADGARPAATLTRKAEHIRINLEEDVDAKGVRAGFDGYRFLHQALPDLNLADVRLETTVLGRSLAAPILISCMTGGATEAERINASLAEAANELRLPMGLGSGRALLEHPEVLPSFQVRSRAPHTLLLANLGAIQLNRGLGVDEARRLLDMLDADALVLHLNPLQEALQPEGDTAFAGLLPRIAELCRRLDRPVIAKEVGWGLAPDLVRSLFAAGVAAVDVAGAGGTSWSEVERHRLADPWRQRVAAAFAGWGIPTAEALIGARRAAPAGLVFASGGVRDGVDIAKAVALGADLVGLAGPFLRAAAEGPERAIELGTELATTLRVAMFCVGAAALGDLRGTPRLLPPGGSAPALHTETLHYATPEADRFLDITDDVQAVVARSGVRQGHVQVFSQHTTAAIRINENEPLLLDDFRALLDRIAPRGGYQHDDMPRRNGVPPDEPVNGHAHSRHLLLSTSEMVPVQDAHLGLGTWQRLFLVELCSPRRRAVTVQVTGWT
ncbi:MAG: type 2 isopentenyl-diphosphate Delta-isomerase [Candidatus Dormiibacterota bacterium]